MLKGTRIHSWIMLMVLLLAPLTGCTGSDASKDQDAEKAVDTGRTADRAVVGSFVGKVSGTEAFVAVVAAPGKDGKNAVQVFLSDGKGLSESFTGPVSDSGFAAKSADGDAETEGKLAADSVTGTVALPGGKTGEYTATPPSGAAGLYEIKVSSGGEVSGASAAGLGVTGQITLGKKGTGTLRLVDGRRLKLAVTQTKSAAPGLGAGQVRLIILSDGELRGVAKGRQANGPHFLIGST